MICKNINIQTRKIFVNMFPPMRQTFSNMFPEMRQTFTHHQYLTSIT